MPPKQAEPKIINPNLGKEIGHGFLYGFLNILGMVIGLMGIIASAQKNQLTAIISSNWQRHSDK